MKRVLDSFALHKKWLLALMYLLVAVLWAWPRRHMVPAPFGDFTRDMVVLALALTGFICLVQLLRLSVFLKRRFARGVRRAGLRNEQGEYPVLISTRKDKDKSHGIILNIKNVGVPIPNFDRKVESLQTSLEGIIYCMEYGRKVSNTQVYFLPQKYVRSTIIFPTDDAIGKISLQQLVNLLVIGATGTGKTVAIKIIMAKISTFRPDAKIWLLDFKRFDFRGFSGLPRYYGYTDCVQGINDYYDAFKKQQEAGAADGPNYLVIDEWGSLIMSLDKKEAEQLKGKLAELLMLGRAYQFFPIIGIQRPDASYFASCRDNFNSCIALGILHSNLIPA